MNVSSMSQKQKIEYLTSKPIPGLVCQMAVPTIISMLVTSFYNMADTYFVGKLDTNATAAVGVAFSIMALIQAFGFLFGHGSGNYISRKLGSGEFEAAGVMAANGFFSAFFTGMIITILGMIFLEPLCLFLGATPEFLEQTKEYLGIILIGAPFMMSQFVLNNHLRFQGSASYAMIGIVAGAVVNIGLDPLFIFVFKMGVSGAAAATVISQIISFFILWKISRKSESVKAEWKNFHPNLQSFKEILRGGLPSLCRQGLGSLATICLNRSAGMFAGEYAVQAIAAMSVVTRITMFANSALIGFGQGFQPVCGMNYGAKKYDRVRQAYWFCVKVAFCFLLVISVLGIIFAEPLVTVFRKDDFDVIRIGSTALRFQCIAFPLNAWIVMCNMYLQTIGKATQASIVAAARQGIFFIPLIFILPFFFGLTGVQITQMISDIGAFLLSLPIGISVLREMKQQEDSEDDRKNIGS